MKKVGNNEGLLSWSGNTRFSGGSIDGVKKIWGDFPANDGLWYPCEYITSIPPCFARSIVTKKK